jgi:hypothetical protein
MVTELNNTDWDSLFSPDSNIEQPNKAFINAITHAAKKAGVPIYNSSNLIDSFQRKIHSLTTTKSQT